jgi:hypothetical protein
MKYGSALNAGTATGLDGDPFILEESKLVLLIERQLSIAGKS